jgi:hypothetical protein
MVAWRNRQLIANPDQGAGSVWDTRSFNAYDRHSDAATRQLTALREHGRDDIAAALKAESAALSKIARQHHYSEPVARHTRTQLADARRVLRDALAPHTWLCADAMGDPVAHISHSWTGPAQVRWYCPGFNDHIAAEQTRGGALLSR